MFRLQISCYFLKNNMKITKIPLNCEKMRFLLGLSLLFFITETLE
ncbi:hypothetical protein B4070_4328 [Bacillus subtilis]|nr:hypothetical protein B4070_4328 [Bacillus subtilis]